MISTDGFSPRWASPPGDTIRDALAERGMGVEDFARSIDFPIQRIGDLLDGTESLSIDLARSLADTLGGSVEFWITRDGQYRDDLARVAADQWAKDLPLTQMAQLGWIDKPRDWHEGIQTSLKFFGVPDVDGWRRQYLSHVAGAKFRASPSLPVDRNAVTAWLRKGETEADKLECEYWSPERLSQNLVAIRALTRIKDPASFLPQLRVLCAEAGVAVVIVRAPRGCPISGVARFLDDSTASIMLSARYRSDDHLWFTFFHEAAHLLLHDSNSVYLDELDASDKSPQSSEELEADAFARDILVPQPVRERLQDGRPTPRQLISIARESGISPGILVGQLQHQGVLGYRTGLNGLKRRYRWNGPNLEKA